jgi:hypothetical protein
MSHGLQLLRALFLVTVSFDLAAATPSGDTAIALSRAATLTAAPDLSTWLLLAAGAIGVVVARRRT